MLTKFSVSKIKKNYSSPNDDGSPPQMSVKKIFERNVKNSRLGGVGLWKAPSPRVEWSEKIFSEDAAATAFFGYFLSLKTESNRKEGISCGYIYVES